MRKILTVLLLAASLLTTGCGGAKVGDEVLYGEFKVKEAHISDSIKPDLYVLVDEETGVNYFFIVTGYSKALCPRYDSEGKVIIDPID